MRPDPRVLLADVDRAGADIERFIDGMDRETYVGDARTQAARSIGQFPMGLTDLPGYR